MGSIVTAASDTASALRENVHLSQLNQDKVPVLYPRGTPSGKAEEEYIASLTIQANAAAKSLACGSILAGQSSEADEYGDVAFWLGEGDYGVGHESQVLEALRLEGQLNAETKVIHMDLSSETQLPSTLRLPSLTEETKALIELLSQLRDVHCFRIENMSGSNGLVAYVLLGQRGHGWVGLLGIGVWT
ncbi:uncharacterized protein LAESUDRAFT_727779 [Laetiporus sulphureus 93-53]|uniref:Uncharacterized protein n=1 Tax=Laetiporus sulphureus 93-53 TaxID=1314785 RepID=A0A165DD70_9APHY|nr:uncharacterized protein LAESUDRAFT_727779 [Laetiporus sulphureus 93-53]KZT04607.1 hypothetical protein LAESUDRAFT_727779 [Laetiporus sulphureus 93-53]